AGEPAPAGLPVVLWKRIEPTLAAAQAAQQNLANMRLEGVTGEQGRVSFDVEAGDYFVQVPSHRLDPTLVTVAESGGDWQEFDLPGVTRLEGRIRNSDGTPVANTSMWLHSGDQDYSTMSLYYTDADGRYAIENLAPKPYALSIIKSVADQSAQHVREVIGGGAPSQVFDVTFPPLTASIHGQLTDGNGVGIEGCWIGVEFLDAPHRSILAGWVGTDATGHFTVPRLEPGRHIVRTAWASFQNVYSEEVTLTAGEDREIDLVAPPIPGKHIRGHMIAADGGRRGGNLVFVRDGKAIKTATTSPPWIGPMWAPSM
ncbi:MAG: carboxypeptidase regulatory-like domain-containing protein, partial [Planctomycetes bacterium]|nr:carboxypeptidase regulatory-like domain-containing protein [Planctomycetota bacterium]